jgi:hypothetical protein
MPCRCRSWTKLNANNLGVGAAGLGDPNCALSRFNHGAAQADNDKLGGLGLLLNHPRKPLDIGPIQEQRKDFHRGGGLEGSK